MSHDKFHRIILPLKDKLFRLAWSIVRNPAEAEDIVQNVFLKLWTKNNEWDKIENLEAYCFRATKNLAFDRVEPLSLRRTENITSESGNVVFADNITPLFTLVETERNTLIYKCIDELSENQKNTLKQVFSNDVAFKKASDDQSLKLKKLESAHIEPGFDFCQFLTILFLKQDSSIKLESCS